MPFCYYLALSFPLSHPGPRSGSCMHDAHPLLAKSVYSALLLLARPVLECLCWDATTQTLHKADLVQACKRPMIKNTSSAIEQSCQTMWSLALDASFIQHAATSLSCRPLVSGGYMMNACLQLGGFMPQLQTLSDLVIRLLRNCTTQASESVVGFLRCRKVPNQNALLRFSQNIMHCSSL